MPALSAALFAPYLSRVRPIIAYYGAVGNGVADDTQAFVDAINSGYSFELDSGTFNVTGDALPRMKTGQTVSGAGRPLQNGSTTAPSVVKKIGTGRLWNLNGTGTEVENRVSGVTLQNFGMVGAGAVAGRAISMDYSDHCHFTDLSCYNFIAQCWGGVEIWDQRAKDCGWDHCGNATVKTGATIWIGGSATDSSNELLFDGCRVENHRGHALYLDANGFPANAPYGIYWTNGGKMESTVRSALPYIGSTNDVKRVIITDSYFSSGNLAGGQSAGPIIGFEGAFNWTIERAHFFVDNDSATTCLYVYSAGGNLIGKLSLVAATAPANGLIQWGSGDDGVEVGTEARGPFLIEGATTARSTGTKPQGAYWADEVNVRPKTASFTFSAIEAKRTEIHYNSATNGVATIPSNASVPLEIGTVLTVVQVAAGVATMTAGAGVNPLIGSVLATGAIGDSRSARKTATDTWLVT